MIFSAPNTLFGEEHWAGECRCGLACAQEHTLRNTGSFGSTAVVSPVPLSMSAIRVDRLHAGSLSVATRLDWGKYRQQRAKVCPFQ